MPFISIIIPVYRAENFLHRCVDSVLQQTYEDFEIILVDDGSPDNSPQICDEYAANDKRIIALHKSNGGASDARNHGILQAKGDYLMFIDSDDYWDEKDCLKTIAIRLKAEKSDIILYKSQNQDFKTGEKTVARQDYNLEIIRHSSKIEILTYLFTKNLLPGAAWSNAVKREFLIRNELFFIKGIKAEDIDWSIKTYLAANKFDAVNDAFYIYVRNRADSVTGSADLKSFNDLFGIIKSWVRKMNEPEYEQIKNAVFSYLSFQLVVLYLHVGRMTKETRNEKVMDLETYSFLLSYGQKKEIRLVHISNKILGTRSTAKVVKILYKLKNKR